MAGDYNGWTNWETWQINLWLDNEEPLYREKVRFLRAVIAPIADLGPTDAMIGYVQRWCESVFPDGTPDMQGDEKETAAEQWAKVNWTEIAEHFAGRGQRVRVNTRPYCAAAALATAPRGE